MTHAMIMMICVAQPDLTRFPYLQSLTSTSAVIAWKTGTPVSGSVDYRPISGPGRTATGEPQTMVHTVTLTGLKPGTEYSFRVLADGRPFTWTGAASVFTTPSAGFSPFSFIVFGDPGCGCPAQKSLAEAMKKFEFSFALLTGDIVYPSGREEDYGPKFFDIYRDILGSRPFYPTLGNHDLRTENGRPYFEAFGKDRYYSFDYNGVHIAALDVFGSTYRKGSPQYQWLENDLGNNTAPWTVVFLHDPPYSTGTHGSNLSIRKALSPLFEKYGVHMVFAGHDHTYERTRPIREFVRNGRPVLYIVSGGGGADLYPVGKNDFTAFSSSRHNFILVRLNRESADIRAIGEDGTAFDSFTLERAAGHSDRRPGGSGLTP